MPFGVLGAVMFLLVAICAIFAPRIAPYNPYASVHVTVSDILARPNAQHLLGTDDAGIDVLSELIYGARVSLIVGFFAAFMAIVIGTFVGLVAGYFGGRIGNFLMRFVDVLLVIPFLPLMMVIIALFGRGLWKIVFVLGLLGWTFTARLVRSQVVSIKERQYVTRARNLGASDFSIILKHIFPQSLPLIVAQTVLGISGAILAESTLSFLGLGDPLLISWGRMINFAFERAMSARAWWYILPPGFAIVWISMSLILVGNTIEEIFNPRIKTHHLFNPKRMVSILLPKLGNPVLPEKMNNTAPLIDVSDICIDYHRENGVILHALTNVGFSLDTGQSLGIVGESGCGKTTLMLSLLRLLPKEGRIIHGKVMFEDMNLLQLSEAEMRDIRWKKIAIIFQGAMNALNPVRTIESQIMEVMDLHDTSPSKKDSKERVAELLEMVGIPSTRAKQYPHQYSGGMRQRAMIAMALACDPKVLIADEPTTALDVMVQAQIISLLNELKVRLGLALILVTHDLGLVGELCDRALVMYAGMAAEYATVGTIFGKPSHPYTQRLLQAFPNIENTDQKLDSIPGAPPRLDNLPAGCRFAPRCDCALEICRRESPAFIEIDPDHFAACHLLRSEL